MWKINVRLQSTRVALLTLALAACQELDNKQPAGESSASDDDAVLSTRYDSLETSSRSPDRFETITYRGQQRTAARYGDTLVIEGDIVVGAADLTQGPKEQGGHQKSVHTSGVNGGSNLFQWPGGVVPYTFHSSVNAATPAGGTSERNLIRAAMRAWMNAVPGLSFVPRSTETDYIRFIITTDAGICGRSPVGRQGGPQDVELKSSCIPSFSTHHEIGHSLGLFHEQSRTDLTSSITINWSNIKGCTDSATSRSQCGNTACKSNPLSCGCTKAEVDANTCDFSNNFGTDSRSADVNAYDFDSVMHYPGTAFGKCHDAKGNTVLCSAAGSVVQTTLVPPAGTAIGQRTHLSTLDMVAMNVMYPKTDLKTLVFRGTGSRDLCSLVGREDDVGTYFSYTGIPGTGGSPTVNTDTLGNGDYDITCTPQSLFWSKGYRYPNRSVRTSVSELNANPVRTESYAVSATLHVLDTGFMAVLF